MYAQSKLYPSRRASFLQGGGVGAVEESHFHPSPPHSTNPTADRGFSHRLNITFGTFSVLYRVAVTTSSDESGAGTDADVFIQIFGDKGNTSVVELTKSGNLFESGQ